MAKKINLNFSSLPSVKDPSFKCPSLPCRVDRESISHLSFFISHLSFRKGFTLIELMISIGIIAILSTAVIVAINPSENLKKAKDTVTRGMAIDIHNAITEYSTSKSVFPWDSIANGGADCNSGIPPSSLQLSSEGFDSCIDALIGQGSLKESLKEQPSLSSLYLTDKSNGKFMVCFDPESSNDSKDVLSRYAQNGDTGCDNSSSTSCYWCVQ